VGGPRSDFGRQFTNDLIDVARVHHPVHEAQRLRLGRVDESAGEHQLLEARGAHEIQHPVARVPRQAVAERP
jgi:hypothetical protein